MINNIIAGVLVTSLTQVAEVENHVNAIAFMPMDTAELTEYLDVMNNRFTPVIVINDFYRDEANMFVHNDPSILRNAISKSVHFGRVAFMFDEWLHHGTHSGQSRDEVLAIMKLIQKDFPGVEFVHIEAFTDIYNQMQSGQPLKLLWSAQHIGFDCYGDFENCGGFGASDRPIMDYLVDIYNGIIANQSKAKIFLVPGAFMNPLFFDDEVKVMQHLEEYTMTAIEYRDYISGFGVFTWGSFHQGGTDIIGARENTNIKAKVIQSLADIRNN